MAPSTPSLSLFKTRALVSYIGQYQTMLGPFSHFFPHQYALHGPFGECVISNVIRSCVTVHLNMQISLLLPSYEYLVVLIPNIHYYT